MIRTRLIEDRGGCVRKRVERVLFGLVGAPLLWKTRTKVRGCHGYKRVRRRGPRKLLVTLEDSLSERRPQAERTRSPNGCKAQYLGGWLGPFRYRFAISPTITRGAEYVRID